MNSYDLLISKLDSFIRKYYKNELLKGAIYSFLLLSSFFITIVLIEYFGEFNSTGRFILFLGFLSLTAITFIRYLIVPFTKLYRLGNIISYQEAALIIGKHFPNVQDKILNTLQLEGQKNSMKNENLALIEAGIEQKMIQLNPVPFNIAVNFKENLRYLKGILAVILLFILISIVDSNIIFSSVNKLINYTEVYNDPLPYYYQINADSLKVLEEEDFTLNIKVSGKEIPSKIYVVFDDNKHYVKNKGNSLFEFEFRNVQNPITFYLTDGEHNSKKFLLSTIPKPSLQKFDVVLNYPSYIDKSNDTIENIGDLEIPEGTNVNWVFKTKKC